ncbi:hypothetical protein GPALN_011913 [Globodera pallida]|nr:hypothetical protein GPALN_011913 [Globodera pallida]
MGGVGQRKFQVSVPIEGEKNAGGGGGDAKCCVQRGREKDKKAEIPEDGDQHQQKHQQHSNDLSSSDGRQHNPVRVCAEGRDRRNSVEREETEQAVAASAAAAGERHRW